MCESPRVEWPTVVVEIGLLAVGQNPRASHVLLLDDAGARLFPGLGPVKESEDTAVEGSELVGVIASMSTRSLTRRSRPG